MKTKTPEVIQPISKEETIQMDTGIEIDLDFDEEIRKRQMEEASRLFKQKRLEFMDMNSIEGHKEQLDGNKKTVKDLAMEIELLKEMMTEGKQINKRASFNFDPLEGSNKKEWLEPLNELYVLMENKIDRKDLNKLFVEMNKINETLDKFKQQ